MDELEVNVIFEGATSEPSLLGPVLELVETIDPFSPGYWGPHERKRNPWSREAVLADVATDKSFYGFLVSGIHLWRTKVARYEGVIMTSDRSVNSVTLDYSPGPSPKHLRAIFDSAERLVNAMRTVFAYVHPVWKTGVEVEGVSKREIQRYAWGLRENEVDIHKSGLKGIFARTWFGPMLIERIGRERLLGISGAHEEDWGGIRLDLHSEPWSAGFKELAARKDEVMRELQGCGMFRSAEWSPDGQLVKNEAAPSWTPPEWVMRAKRKDERR